MTSAVDYAFDDLAHALRRLSEAKWNFHSLGQVDFPEAVGNFESSLNGVFAGVHCLFDASRSIATWHSEPSAQVVLSVRNARQHNHANRIRSFAGMMRLGDLSHRRAAYVVTAGDRIENMIPLSMGDMYQFTLLPKKVSRLSATKAKKLRVALRIEETKHVAESIQRTIDDMFFDINPYISDTMKNISNDIGSDILPLSDEGRAFFDFFTQEPAVNFADLKMFPLGREIYGVHPRTVKGLT